MIKITTFEAANYLDNEQTIAAYLNAALADPNPDVFLLAIQEVAKARGISNIANASGLGRESLYKTLRPGSKPRFETMVRVLNALGVKLRTTA